MNHFVAGILKLILLEATAAWLLVDRLAPPRMERALRVALWALAGAAVFAWANFGQLRGNGQAGWVLTAVPLLLAASWLVRRIPRRAVGLAAAGALVAGWVGTGISTGSAPLVHGWEQYHFYFGAKYQRELGWFNLYKATLLADREGVHALDGVETLRSARTFELEPVEVALADAPAVRARFSDARWAEFKQDWQTFTRLTPANWRSAMTDHGYTASPAWAVVAHPLAEALPLTPFTQSLMGWLDMLLALAAWAALYAAFGARGTAVGLVLWAAPPIVFDYLAGSFLRWDWLFALALATAWLQRGRWGRAGAAFGYATASKLFPLMFGVALGLNALQELWRTRKVRPEWVRFALGASAAGALLVATSTAMFGASAWPEYAGRIRVTQEEKFYSIQYSLKTVYLQWAASSWPERTEGIFASELKQARADVDAADHAAGLLAVRLAFTGLVLVLLWGAAPSEAFTLGPLLVFTWLTVNMYYWNMLGLLALGLYRRPGRAPLGMLVGLLGIFVTFYVYQHLNRGYFEGYAVALLLSGWLAVGAAWSGLEQRARRPVS